MDNSNKYINPDNPVYISYSHADPDYPDLEEDVKALCELLDKHQINYSIDKKDCPYKGNINEYEQAIGGGKAVIVVASDKYYRSPHTMTEWHYMLDCNGIEKRVFMILLDNNIKDTKKRDEYRNLLSERFQDSLQQHDNCVKEHRDPGSLGTVTRNVINFSGFIDDFDKLCKYTEDYNRGNGIEAIRDNNYNDIIEPLKKYLMELSEPNRLRQENIELKSRIKVLVNERQCFNNQIELLKCRNKVFSLNGLPIKLIRIGGGSLKTDMGCEQIKDYFMSETPITQSLWENVMGYNDSLSNIGDNHPVDNVTFFDAVLFCNKLSSLLNKQEVYCIKDVVYDKSHIVKATVTYHDFSCDGFRLPSPEEWIFAAQCGDVKHFKYSGSDNIDYVAWYLDNSTGITHAVKTKCCNELGLYDMSGNVSEWCHTEKLRSMYFGGSCISEKVCCEIPDADNYSCEKPGIRAKDIGFRIVFGCHL